MLILDVSEISLLNLIVIVEQGNVSGREFFTRSAVTKDMLDPWELQENSILPFRAVIWFSPFLLLLIKILERLYIFLEKLFGLLLRCRQDIHILIAAVISLLTRVLNSFLKSLLKSFIIRDGNAKKRIIFVERFHFLNFEALLLEGIFLFLREATIVSI
jgi:hypothetical protein